MITSQFFFVVVIVVTEECPPYMVMLFVRFLTSL